jgi:thiol-disulfide isomerase/thioredoxin
MLAPNGRYLAGKWLKNRPDGMTSMEFMAFPSQDPSDIVPDWPERQTDPIRFRWAINFDKSGAALGVFATEPREDFWKWEAAATRMSGTIVTPTGDYRHISGLYSRQRDELSIELSVFDGAHAFLFIAEVDPDTGDLTNGHFYSGNHWHETFTARRLAEGEAFELPDPFSEVSLKPGVTRLGLAKLNEPPYAGKPTIVQIMGTWCPNCHDEAPALVDLYEEYHDDGLQILSLCYEYADDAERSRRQIERFKERHGATWEFVAAGTSDKTKAAATLPALSAIKSYPTTIWINPDGTVRAIHSGFSGPATGEKHTETLEEFERLTREIVEAPAPSP